MTSRLRSKKISALQAEIDAEKRHKSSAANFLRTVRKYTEIKELTPTIVNKLIEKIVVHLRLLRTEETRPLLRLVRKTFDLDIHAINTTSLMHLFIVNLCQNSSLKTGLCFSEPVFHLMKAVMAFTASSNL